MQLRLSDGDFDYLYAPLELFANWDCIGSTRIFIRKRLAIIRLAPVSVLIPATSHRLLGSGEDDRVGVVCEAGWYDFLQLRDSHATGERSQAYLWTIRWPDSVSINSGDVLD